ncbi:uncharacterized protein LAESUDRAFT_648667 [Laetiporus sulphureus 93-53]|uniref:Uncharacterized protein n=1 Tax=Laetiporus sulphureus 93-53 TaxID=1314785 RepID=A0A165F9K8_9APHY|nr:uncharacterized protein LAESUDRAFT_648667 [Laetiporus sulphureus 93-53]KZT08637.1 hypothetical protein LAESUDRAFT_648667 [Laetiporus sulphureus 93-53]
MKTFYLRTVLTLLAATRTATADDQPCTARDGDDYYDLSSLKSSTDYRFKSPGGYEFVLNVCKPVVSDMWAIKVDDPAIVGGFSRHERGDFSIGNTNSTLVVQNGHPTLLMTGGSRCPGADTMTASTVVRFTCDTSVLGQPELVAQLPPSDVDACSFFIEWRSHVACPTHEKTGRIGFVTVLAAILTTLFMLYILVGTFYNRYVLELRGFEQIPRISFFAFSDIIAFFGGCMDRTRHQPSWHSNGGGTRRRGSGSGYTGLAEEEEAMMAGPPGFLDEHDEEDVRPQGAHGSENARPAGIDADGIIPPTVGAYTTSNYPMYAQEEDSTYLMYQQQMPYHQVVHPGPPPRQLSETDLQQAMHYQRSLNMMPPQAHYAAPVYNASPPHGVMPLSGSPPPSSPNMYDPLSPPVSGSDTSADGIYHHSRNSSLTGSPSSSRANSLVHRHSLRYNPTPSPTSSSTGRRSRGRSFSDDDDIMGVAMAESLANTRKEATRRQRIEAEQRRRDELRDGYARLKEVLPVSNQKSSKVSLLERATNHIVSLEKQNRQLQARLAQVEQEVQRLRALNEKISLGVANTPSPGQVNMDARPLSPPPEDSQQAHRLTSVAGQEPPSESSPSASEKDY